MTKGLDQKWDTLPQNQTPNKLFSVLPLQSGMFQATISVIKKIVLIQVCAVWHQNRSGQVWMFVTMDRVNVIQRKKHLCAILMLLVHLTLAASSEIRAVRTNKFCFKCKYYVITVSKICTQKFSATNNHFKCRTTSIKFSNKEHFIL